MTDIKRNSVYGMRLTKPNKYEIAGNISYPTALTENQLKGYATVTVE